MPVRALPILLALASCATSVIIMTTAAIARDSDTPSYSIEDVRACSREAMRLCRDKLPDLDAIEDCMKAHYDELTPACQARFNR